MNHVAPASRCGASSAIHPAADGSRSARSGAPARISSASARSSACSAALYDGLFATTASTMSGSRRCTESYVNVWTPSDAASGGGSAAGSEPAAATIVGGGRRCGGVDGSKRAGLSARATASIEVQIPDAVFTGEV